MPDHTDEQPKDRVGLSDTSFAHSSAEWLSIQASNSHIFTSVKGLPGKNSASPITIGRFSIERELGQGAFGIVFLAHDPKLQRHVALKLARSDTRFSSDTRRRLEIEARAAAALDHPNIVPIYEAGEAGPFFYITTAYCEGPNMATWLRAREDLPTIQQAAAIVAVLSRAVAFAHQRGIVHRDIKPGNVMLTPVESSRENGELHFEPRLTDFGLAKVVGSDLQDTRSSRIVGTPLYMSPEQISHARHVGPPADIYALGAILFELITGKPPLEGESHVEVMDRVRNNPAPLAGQLRSGVPVEVDVICAKCLEKDPLHRYKSAEELAEDLERFLRGEPIKARRLSVMQKIVRFCCRKERMRDAGIYAMGFNAVLGVWLTVVAITMGLGLSPVPSDVAQPTMVHCFAIVAILLVPTGMLGYFVWRKKRIAIWIAAAVSIFHLVHVITGLNAQDVVFKELYDRSPEFRQMQFVLLIIGMGIQAILFALAAIADFTSHRRRRLP